MLILWCTPVWVLLVSLSRPFSGVLLWVWFGRVSGSRFCSGGGFVFIVVIYGCLGAGFVIWVVFGFLLIALLCVFAVGLT